MVSEKSVESIIKKMSSPGHRPYLVTVSSGDLYILKPLSNLHDKHSIIKEFFCTYLLEKWHIKCPSIALLAIPEELKMDDRYQNDRRFTYSSTYFGSKVLSPVLELNQLTGGSHNFHKKIVNPEILFKIALFDIWIENDDRRPANSNILFHQINKSLHIIPIDHAFTFANLTFNQLQHTKVSFSDNDSILNSPLAKKYIKSNNLLLFNVDYYEEYFYLCVNECQAQFDTMVAKLPFDYALDDVQKSILAAFLFNKSRNSEVFDTFKYILASIKS